MRCFPVCWGCEAPAVRRATRAAAPVRGPGGRRPPPAAAPVRGSGRGQTRSADSTASCAALAATWIAGSSSGPGSWRPWLGPGCRPWTSSRSGGRPAAPPPSADQVGTRAWTGFVATRNATMFSAPTSGCETSTNPARHTASSTARLERIRTGGAFPIQRITRNNAP